MNLRDRRQVEFAKAFIERAEKYKKGGILYICPRMGKIRISCIAMQGMGFPKTLIAYPDDPVKKSWEKEFKEIGFDNANIQFTTHRSLEKRVGEKWDLLVLDEIHLLSEAQKEAVNKIEAKEVLGLTGTMTEWTERDLGRDLDLYTVAYYPIEQAIEEGVITDYEITVIKVPLDTREKIYKKGTRSEKQQFDAYGWVIEKNKAEGMDTFKLRLGRMRIIQNSIAKLKATKWILSQAPKERILVFCGVTAIADKLECPSYHSLSKEKAIFEEFASGKGNHLAVCKLGNTGVTYKPLNRVLVNYFDSNGENLAQKLNRAMAMEYNNLSKKAFITIISSNEPVELSWLHKALEFFSPEKVKYADIRELYPAQV
jgi:hypothetical protein